MASAARLRRRFVPLLAALLLALPAASAGPDPPAALRPGADCRPRDHQGRLLITEAAIEQLERCLAALPQTRTLHTRSGAYTPERQALHARLLDAVRARAACVRGRPPMALLTGGPPGAGKSTWLMRHAPITMRATTLWIDADRLRAQLPEYRGWKAAATQEESGDLVQSLLDGIGRPCRTDVFYDGTMARPDRYRHLVPALRALGYRVYILNVTVPESLSRRRVLDRYRASGRYVPRAAIAAYYAGGPATLRLLAPMADGWLQIDGASGAILSSGGEPLPMG
jgi:predicted ABC-type ATPase